MGAETIKVEPPAGDALAAVAPQWYADLNDGVAVHAIDLKSPDGFGELENLLSDADVLLTAMRPSAARRLGLFDLVEQQTKLCHVEIVGYDGADEDKPGHDLTYQAAYGLLQPPSLPLVPIADVLGSEMTVSAALGLLMARARSGVGQRDRVVLDRAAQRAAEATRYGVLGPNTPLGGALPSYQIYKSKDALVALGAVEPHFQQRICELLSIGGSYEEFATAFRTQTSAQWEEFGKQHDLPLVPVQQTRPAAS